MIFLGGFSTSKVLQNLTEWLIQPVVLQKNAHDEFTTAKNYISDKALSQNAKKNREAPFWLADSDQWRRTNVADKYNLVRPRFRF